jgi:hypothetical protein
MSGVPEADVAQAGAAMTSRMETVTSVVPMMDVVQLGAAVTSQTETAELEPPSAQEGTT